RASFRAINFLPSLYCLSLLLSTLSRFEISMSKGGSSKVMTMVPAGNERVITTPKFKRRKVSV
ncbi:hypothetical protein J1N35_025490, partial [Gossypium stocksii]